MKIKIYGCRGSLPTTRERASAYGSNTSCITIETAEQTLILDAGSGIAQMDRFTKLFSASQKPFDILLSHLHIDHLIGLTVFSKVWMNSPDELVKLYTLSRDDRPLKEQIFGIFSPPYWPVPMAQFANAQCIALECDKSIQIGQFTVTPFLAAHPDQTTSFHITDSTHSVVYMLDSEIPALTAEGRDSLLAYCRHADLLVFDAAYSAIDYPTKKGWGHSTIEDGFQLAAECGCKKILFTHFGFEYGDQELAIYESQVRAKGEGFIFARDGMEFMLS